MSYRVYRVTPKLSINLVDRKCEGNTGEALEQEEMLCDDLETLRKFTYIGAGWGCEAAVTARIGCGWV